MPFLDNKAKLAPPDVILDIIRKLPAPDQIVIHRHILWLTKEMTKYVD